MQEDPKVGDFVILSDLFSEFAGEGVEVGLVLAGPVQVVYTSNSHGAFKEVTIEMIKDDLVIVPAGVEVATIPSWSVLWSDGKVRRMQAGSLAVFLPK